MTKNLFIINITFILFSISIALQIKKQNELESEKQFESKFIISNPETNSSLITLKFKNDNNTQFSIGITDKENFSILKKDLKTIITEKDKKIILNSPSILIESLNINNNLNYYNNTQWKLYYINNFEKNNSNEFTFGKISKCGKNINILGGNCLLSNKEIKKEFENLPKHSLIKIEGKFNFIGDWNKNTGYLKYNDNNDEKVLWTGRCETNKNDYILKEGFCHYQICKIGEFFSVSFSHKNDNLKIIFGANLNDDSCQQSYGISDIRIYIK